ncbi:arginase [Rhodoferax sp. TS-BS-61-7]|uniref:arginase n=1 Tax=Rhodoferax sp. TS-BS-61-7 TaxID=2094194 RepID=UPI000CF60618|nr:arginase [Rhodoferax sp. TS-BS-61-7]PQA78510.1 arginase [Rhodoferax sp. TS-BS-61-7]
MNTSVLHLIGAAVGEGASDGGCKWGAAALREHGIANALAATGRTAIWGDTVTAQPMLATSRLNAIEGFSERLAGTVAQVLRQNQQPLVLGGDHSCAVGTWSAVADHLRPQGALGLVWIDAHLDAHTPETSDSQAPHGMPVAALLGHGSEGMTDLFGWRHKLRPEHLVIIGARSYEPAERALLDSLGVRVMYMPEVLERGFAACFDEARARVQAGTVGWGISFDLDGLDPRDAPGTGTPVEQGIRLADALQVLTGCSQDSRFMALELTEYNPLRDFGGQTAQAATDLVCAVLAPEATALGLAA